MIRSWPNGHNECGLCYIICFVWNNHSCTTQRPFMDTRTIELSISIELETDKCISIDDISHTCMILIVLGIQFWPIIMNYNISFSPTLWDWFGSYYLSSDCMNYLCSTSSDSLNIVVHDSVSGREAASWAQDSTYTLLQQRTGQSIPGPQRRLLLHPHGPRSQVSTVAI